MVVKEISSNTMALCSEERLTMCEVEIDRPPLVAKGQDFFRCKDSVTIVKAFQLIARRQK